MEFPSPIVQSRSQIHSPSESLSMPSEPHDIGNWFPSYQYESPIIGRNEIFGESCYEIGKEKLCISGSERAKEEESLRGLDELEKKDKILVGEDKREQPCEIVDSSCSDSLLSEPIDVRNWFSSYVYESPALDTSDGFRDSSVYKESGCEGDEFDVEEIEREKAETYGDFWINSIGNDVESSDGLIKCNDFCGDNKQEKLPFNKADIRSVAGNRILSDKKDVCFQSAVEHSSEYAMLQSHRNSTSKDIAISNLKQEDSQRSLKFCDGNDVIRRSVPKSSEKCQWRVENKEDAEEKGYKEVDGFLSSVSDLKPGLINKTSTRKSAQRCKDEENGDVIANDGFVSTRRGRFSRESEENNHLKTRRGNAKEEHCVTERKALAERTNFNLSSVTEITGKWKCPQKRKPNLGPPLKQLRLEQWVHKL